MGISDAKKSLDQQRRETKKLALDDVKELAKIVSPKTLIPERGGDPRDKRKFFLDREANQMMKDYHPPQVWETLEPKAGVIFQEGAKQKRGPAFLISSRENNIKTPLRMTRQEYSLKMTRLVATQSLLTDSLNKTQTFQQSSKLLAPISLEVPRTMPSDRLPQSQTRGFHHFRSSSQIKERPSVKVHSSKFLETLNSREEPPSALSILQANSARVIHNRTKSDMSRFMQETSVSMPTETDQFNLKILNSVEWGKSPVVNAYQTPLVLPKTKHSMRASVGRPAKLPRDRNMQQTFYAFKGPSLSNRSLHNTEFWG